MRIDPRPDRFEHRIRATIKITAAEMRVLQHFADMHYDHVCKTFFASGNPGMAWRNSFALPPKEGEEFGDYIDPLDPACPEDLEAVDAMASLRDLDTCMKILEGMTLERDMEIASAAFRLCTDLNAIGDAIAVEYDRVREKEKKELEARGFVVRQVAFPRK